MTIKGIGASKGIAVANVFKIEEIQHQIKKQGDKPEVEHKKYQNAIKSVVQKLEETKAMVLDQEHAMIFDAHISFIQDPTAIESIKEAINNEISAEYAVNEFYKKFAAIFESMDDEYMRERVADINDVSKKLIYSINGIVEKDLTKINEKVIIVADDLSPSQTVQLNKKFTAGFVTNIGGPTSHTAIMARGLNIPSVVGTKNILENVKNGDLIALNGQNGEVIVNPTSEELENYKKMLKNYEKHLSQLAKFKGKKSITTDGVHVELAANIGTPKDLDSVLDNDAEAVGLFRSEFLYMDNDHWPTEEEQFEAYKHVVEGMKGKRVVIRTLDIGGDKILKYYKFPEELNPFLGYRAIRFCLQNLEIFKTQLRALIRASKFGKVAIMFPMITNVPEYLEAKNVFDECYAELQKEKVEIAPKKDIELGLMIETPAAAVLCESFCKYADFVSIGTNDLIQYSMAADRMNEKISYLYQPLNPSILKLIKLTIDGAHKHGKWAGMCGEMAGDSQALPVLLGLGLDEFSMSPGSVLSARELLSRLSKEQMTKLANKALELENETQVKELLQKELGM